MHSFSNWPLTNCRHFYIRYKNSIHCYNMPRKLIKEKHTLFGLKMQLYLLKRY